LLFQNVDESQENIVAEIEMESQQMPASDDELHYLQMKNETHLDVYYDADLPDIALELEVRQDPGNNQVQEAQEEVEDNEDKENEKVDEKVLPSLSFGSFNILSLSVLPGGIQYYTSLIDYEHFKYVFGCLGPAAYQLKYHCKKMKPEDEFLLLLIKLRLNKEDKELSFLFGICPSTVGYIFKTWLNFVYFQFKEVDIWPSKELVENYMPSDFRAKFPSTRCILDGTEFPIEKPSNLRDQSSTWSSYKNRNTLKVMIGISPRGDVTHISDAFGGSTSDRQIVEQSELLSEEKFSPGDSIMADRGFIVQDLFCLKQVQVNIPTVMRGLTQLPAEKVVKDRRIASKRVHVERVIGLGKVFKILKDDLHHNYISIGGHIIFVCFALTNFKPGIVDSHA